MRTEDVAKSTLGDIVLEALGSPTLLSVFGNRMFFNLKEAAEMNVVIGSCWSMKSRNTIIRFGSI